MINEKNSIRIKEIESRLDKLPKGTLTYKTIKGKRQPYLQRTENGKSVSYYIKVNEREKILMELEERKSLQEELILLKTYQGEIAEIMKRQPRMRKTPAIGYQFFTDFYDVDGLYIDKTGFIKEWWESKDAITLITRPRRFGKTLMLSTVECFFSNKYYNRKELFEGFEVWSDPKYRDIQGTIPVIFMTFAAVKSSNFEGSMMSIYRFIFQIYDEHNYLQDSERLDEHHKRLFLEYKEEIYNRNYLYAPGAINVLCELLYRHHGIAPIVLLDEYDTPLQEAYLGGYWDEMILFMRDFFNSTFKTNKFLGRALLTGVARVAKETLFSDLNNISIYTSTSEKYAQYFGFTEQEVEDILDFTDSANKQQVKEFYDGFVFGNYTDIYNPWSILCYAREQLFKCYWIDTGGYELLSRLIVEGDNSLKIDLEALLRGERIHKIINENITFNELDGSSDMVWPLFLCTGYLKAENVVYNLDIECDLSITNTETMLMFRSMVKNWFRTVSTAYNDFCKYLLRGDVESMEDFINDVALDMVSFFDVGRKSPKTEPERFYHGLVLGLIVELKDCYYIISNRESGRGRYDIMLKPLQDELPAILIEFKVYNEKKEKTLEDTARQALAQIEERDYARMFMNEGINAGRIKKYGFAFNGKAVMILESEL